ncbi:FAD-binding protein [Rubrobacter radiotolerans]|uniref:FAD-binding protein n=2 Tax=Rubrobacter radiotolerans TaxID=42256 RepID=A0AB35T097_RUBRA|nr:FAD-binding protein [Rubrobacter radiotolerans]MDX5892708.1 FAD-binding protein [Rubrobacter radiotolerans]SMC02328.1 succinate dehydrogenase subunit A [Rubrobacter radiotolerans DSM 5868]
MSGSDGSRSNGRRSPETYETREFDVLIIGAGGAGMRAAVEAAEKGLSVGIVTKSLLGKAHTVMAEGGMAAAVGNVDPEDSWRQHFVDTMKGGKFINNWRMAEIHAKESPDRVYELEQWGALFNRTDAGRISQRAFGAHTYRRLCHVGDRTGLELIRTMQEKVLATDTEVFMETTVTKLFQDERGRVTGALAYTRASGKFILFKAKATIMASGGWGRIFKVTSNSWEGTGDGAILAYEVGAEMIDMEMVQFHPTGMVWPPGVRGLLVTEGVRGEGGVLRNSEGKRYMGDYDPERMELSSRDVVARANFSEVQAGRGSEHGGVYLDITHLGYDGIMKKLPTMYEQFKNLADVDISKEPMEVFPTIHYTMGGIKVEAENCATTVDGLFAAGECAGGLHGANRLGGNSLSDLLVFGRRAGLGAIEYVENTTHGADVSEEDVQAEIRRVLDPMERPPSDKDESPYLLQSELQDVMMEHANLVRDEDGLKEGLGKVLAIKDRVPNVKVGGTRMFNPGWHACQDIRYLVMVSEMIIRCAIERKEKRGSQWRLDHDELVDEYSNINFISKKGPQGEVEIERREIPPIPDHLAELLEQSQKGVKV